MKRNHSLACIVLCSLSLLAREDLHADDAASTVDVTKIVQKAVKGNALTIKADSAVLGHPVPGTQRKLKVEYTVGGMADSKVVMEDNDLVIQPLKGGRLAVTKALFGDMPAERKVDVTKRLTDAVQADKVSLFINNDSMGGDPAPTTLKKLQVSYTVWGQTGRGHHR